MAKDTLFIIISSTQIILIFPLTLESLHSQLWDNTFVFVYVGWNFTFSNLTVGESFQIHKMFVKIPVTLALIHYNSHVKHFSNTEMEVTDISGSIDSLREEIVSLVVGEIVSFS